MATCLGDALELEVDTDIVQVVRAFRTNKLAMALINSRKAKPDTFAQPLRLSKSEIESLRQEMRQSHLEMRQQLQAAKRKQEH